MKQRDKTSNMVSSVSRRIATSIWLCCLLDILGVNAFSRSNHGRILSKSCGDVARLRKTALHLEVPGMSELLDQPLALAVPTVAAAGALFSSTLVTSKSLVSDEALSEILDGTFLAGKNIECVYKGSKNGFSAVDFHKAVDERGSSLIVARTLTGKVFGGYNPVGWRSTDDYFLSTAAFLWCKGPGNTILKYPIQSGSNAAIFD